MEKILSVSHLGKSFKDKKVLKSISFDVCKGEIMAILGPNGAGKSTTIRSIMGIIYADHREINFENHSEIPRHKIGYLPEERGLYQNVKVMVILLYLEGQENVAIEELSKGLTQKVQFISSIIHEPDLLILDEPFSGLDPVSQDVFKDEIRELANQGTAILLSSHQMNLVEEICDRLFMMQDGQKVIYGSLDDVKMEYANLD